MRGYCDVDGVIEFGRYTYVVNVVFSYVKVSAIETFFVGIFFIFRHGMF